MLACRTKLRACLDTNVGLYLRMRWCSRRRPTHDLCFDAFLCQSWPTMLHNNAITKIHSRYIALAMSSLMYIPVRNSSRIDKYVSSLHLKPSLFTTRLWMFSTLTCIMMCTTYNLEHDTNLNLKSDNKWHITNCVTMQRMVRHRSAHSRFVTCLVQTLEVHWAPHIVPTRLLLLPCLLALGSSKSCGSNSRQPFSPITHPNAKCKMSFRKPWHKHQVF